MLDDDGEQVYPRRVLNRGTIQLVLQNTLRSTVTQVTEQPAD